MKNKNARGFTMIELIIVIAILGILAVFALPRFGNFTSKAQDASRAGVLGTLNSSLAIVQSQWIANGSPNTVTLEGGSAITVNNAGNPDIGITYNSNAGCTTLLNAMLTNTTGLTYTYYAASCTINSPKWSDPITLYSNIAM